MEHESIATDFPFHKETRFGELKKHFLEVGRLWGRETGKYRWSAGSFVTGAINDIAN